MRLLRYLVQHRPQIRRVLTLRLMPDRFVRNRGNVRFRPYAQLAAPPPLLYQPTQNDPTAPLAQEARPGPAVTPGPARGNRPEGGILVDMSPLDYVHLSRIADAVILDFVGMHARVPPPDPTKEVSLARPNMSVPPTVLSLRHTANPSELLASHALLQFASRGCSP